MLRFFACFLFLFVVKAQAQNCDNVKSGLDAQTRPQNASRDIVGQDLDEIRQRGWISFAVYEDFAPYSYEEKGALKGVDIDLGHLIAKDLGLEARFIETQADENVDGDLRNNVWKGKVIGGQVANVMLHVPYDHELACRNELVVFTGQYFNEKIAIAYRESRYPEKGPIPAYFRYDTVGVENDSLSDFYLSGIGNGQITPNMTRYRTTGEAMQALARDEVMAVMGPLGELEFGLSDEEKVHIPPLPGLAKAQWTLGIAVRHNWRSLAYAVDDIVRAAVQDGRMKSIFAAHGLTYTAPDW